MKKILSFMLASAALLAVSCQKEVNPEDLSNADATVTVNVQLPTELLTKANGEGNQIDALHYEIYNEDFTKLVYKPATPATVTTGTATVEFQLVRDGVYSFVFWAQDADSKAYNTSDLLKIEIDYDAEATDGNATGNLESRDAFYAVEQSYTVKDSGNSIEVTLVRPFAQVNFATSDMTGTTGGDITFKNYEITLKGLATVFDTVNGVGITPIESVTFESNSLVDNELHNAKYNYVAMNYILMPQNTQAIIEASATFDIAQAGMDYTIEHSALNFPVQSNYRTNIYGTLFTADGTITASINAVFASPDNDKVIDNAIVAVP